MKRARNKRTQSAGARPLVSRIFDSIINERESVLIRKRPSQNFYTEDQEEEQEKSENDSECTSSSS